MQQAVRDTVNEIPPGARYAPVTRLLSRVEACLFAAHLELEDAIHGPRTKRFFINDAS